MWQMANGRVPYGSACGSLRQCEGAMSVVVVVVAVVIIIVVMQ